MLTDERFARLLEDRARRPELVAELAAQRKRRPLLGADGRLVIVAADHPARRNLRVGGDPFAMADRRRLLDRLVVALRRPGVDGVLATPDIVEDLLLLGELDDKVVFGSMNRGGLTGSVWELDDRFTAYDAAWVEGMGLDGGKMLLRLDLADPGTNLTLEACARAVTDLAARGLVAMVEPLPATRGEDGRVRVVGDDDRLVEAVAVASGLGASSAFTWLKMPAPRDPRRVFGSTTLPVLLLGGDPSGREDELVAAWRAAFEAPNVRGMVAGRSLLYPADGRVERWVDLAVSIVHGET